MKAPKQPHAEPEARAPINQPDGVSQLRVDESHRQGAQRAYLGRLHAHASNNGAMPAQLHGGVPETLLPGRSGKPL